MKPTFVPQLIIPNGVIDISFYAKAFNAIELWRLNNDDGSVHVAGLAIDGTLFHIHEQTANSGFSPATHNGSTVDIGLMVDDVHAVVAQAEAAGAKVISPVTDHDYGYRQGNIVDPFGHRWTIQKIIDDSILMSGG
jgi:PhnB protein